MRTKDNLPTFKKPNPNSDESWMDYAACINVENPDIFFPDFKNMAIQERELLIEEAQEYCNVCPVRKRCEEYSKIAANGWGIWGKEIYGIIYRRRDTVRREARVFIWNGLGV